MLKPQLILSYKMKSNGLWERCHHSCLQTFQLVRGHISHADFTSSAYLNHLFLVWAGHKLWFQVSPIQRMRQCPWEHALTLFLFFFLFLKTHTNTKHMQTGQVSSLRVRHFVVLSGLGDRGETSKAVCWAGTSEWRMHWNCSSFLQSLAHKGSVSHSGHKVIR